MSVRARVKDGQGSPRSSEGVPESEPFLRDPLESSTMVPDMDSNPLLSWPHS